MTRTLLFAELLVDVTREDVVVENDFTTLVALVKIEQFNIETRVLLETNDLVELNAFFELNENRVNIFRLLYSFLSLISLHYGSKISKRFWIGKSPLQEMLLHIRNLSWIDRIRVRIKCT